MRRGKLISFLTVVVAITMISIGMVIQNDTKSINLNTTKVKQFDIKNMAASANMIVKDTPEAKETASEAQEVLKEVQMETAPASVIVPPRVEVFENMTIEELTEKLNRSLGGIMAGHGDIIATHSIEMGVDPYVVTAIMMHETGNGTSNISNNCFNFGGQKGSGCGAYRAYGSIEEGLRGMIDNLYNNYYAQGLTTVETIAPRYAESSSWPAKINWYVEQIRAK